MRRRKQLKRQLGRGRQVPAARRTCSLLPILSNWCILRQPLPLPSRGRAGTQNSALVVVSPRNRARQQSSCSRRVDRGAIYACWRLQRRVCGVLGPIRIDSCGLLRGIGRGVERIRLQFKCRMIIGLRVRGRLGSDPISGGIGRRATGRKEGIDDREENERVFV